MYHSAVLIASGSQAGPLPPGRAGASLGLYWKLFWSKPTMPTLWAKTAEYGNISVGDDLPILVKFEFRPPVPAGAEAPKEDPVNIEKVTGFVKELLLKAFPPDNVHEETTSIETDILTEFLPGDTVSVCGLVVGKSEEGGNRTVECQVTVESQEGEILAKARAVVSF